MSHAKVTSLSVLSSSKAMSSASAPPVRALLPNVWPLKFEIFADRETLLVRDILFDASVFLVRCTEISTTYRWKRQWSSFLEYHSTPLLGFQGRTFQRTLRFQMKILRDNCHQHEHLVDHDNNVTVVSKSVEANCHKQRTADRIKWVEISYIFLPTILSKQARVRGVHCSRRIWDI